MATILTFAEQRDGKLRRASLEVVSEARRLAGGLGASVTAVLIGPGTETLAPELASHGADRVVVFDDAAFGAYATEAYALALAQAISDAKPSVVLLPFTAMGKDLAPRVAASIRVLDPSAGIGHFRSASPECIRLTSRWVEIELDTLTARILKQLHPNTEGQGVVFHDAFENVRLLENQFDLAISNVPFGNFPVVDRSIKDSGLKRNIHDYFFVKALSLVKPGGIIAFITSRYTLDKKNSAIREYLPRRAELLAAVRLPDTASTANAVSQVVTDILILRKRAQVLDGTELPAWINTYMAPR